MFLDPDQFRFRKYQNLVRHSLVYQFVLALIRLTASRQRTPSRKSSDPGGMVAAKSRRQQIGVCDQTRMAHNRRRAELDHPRVLQMMYRTRRRRHVVVDRQGFSRTYSSQALRILEIAV